MKKIIKLLLMLAIILHSACLMAQSTRSIGIYKTENDFINNKLSYAIDCGSKNGSIRLHNFFGSSKVDVELNNQEYSLQKSELFGYHDCDGSNYRFYGNQMYKIADSNGFYVYTRLEYEPGKSSYKVMKYYFSKDGNSPVESLTIQHLAKAFSANIKFCYAVKGFTSDSQLAEFDIFLQTYKIKYLYAQSLKG